MTGIQQRRHALCFGLILLTWLVLCLTGLQEPLGAGWPSEVLAYTGIGVVLMGVVFGRPAPNTEPAVWTWLRASELWSICGGTALLAGRWHLGLLLVSTGYARVVLHRSPQRARRSWPERWAEAWREQGSFLLGVLTLLLLLAAFKEAISAGGPKAHRLELGLHGVLLALAGIAWAGRTDGAAAFSSEIRHLLQSDGAATRLALLALAPFCAFLVLAYLVRLPQIADLDHAFVHLVYRRGEHSVRNLMRAISNAGGEDMAAIWLPLIAISLAIFRRGRSLRFFLAANFGVFGIETIFKTLVFRARPDLTHGSHFDSFPSGHTLAAVILAGTLWLILWPTAAHKGRLLLVIAAIAWPLLMGASRIYLGRHYLTDVIGSWLLGTVWLLVGSATLLALDSRRGLGPIGTS